MNNVCSVNSRSKNKNVTCLSKDQLLNLVELHNDCIKNKNTQECSDITSNNKINTSQNKIDLLNDLKKSLDIKDEKDIKNYNFLKKNKKTYLYIKYLIYKKKLPDRLNGWLTTSDIDTVMLQYSLKHKFNYLGAVPSDHFSKNSLKIKHYPVGIIFNTDPSHLPGSHWVSMIIYKNNEVEYFDSNGMKPNKYICKFIKSINGKLINYNKESFQKKDGLCGIYAMYFLINKLKKNSLSNFEKSDKKMLYSVKEYYYIKNDFLKKYK